MPRPKSSTSTSVIASRFRTTAPSAGPLVVSASSIPYIDASRAPRPDGTNTASTATIAPTAEIPPRNGIVASPGSLPTERSRKYSPAPPITHVPQ